MMKQNLRLILMTLLCAVFSTAWGQTTTTYTFTSKSWEATCNGDAANWTSGKDGSGFSNNGVQVTSNTNSTGANATSPVSFSNISRVVVTYNTNKSAGDGSIVIKVGDNEAVTNPVGYSGSGDGRTANFTTEFNFATTVSGSIQLTANCTTNSLYIVSIAITTSGGQSGPIDPTVTFASNSVRVGIGATTTNVLTVPDGLTVTCSSSNPDVATYDPSTGVVTGVAEGEATITASWDAVEGQYNASSTSFTVIVSNTLIATYNFNGTNDYGSGVSVISGNSQEYADAATWTSDGVRLATAGRYRWFLSNNEKTLRLYKANGDVSNGSMTFSLTNGDYVITRIEFDSNLSGITTSAGSFNGSVWEGICNTITFTHDGNSGSQNIKTINITYGPAPTVPVAISEVGYATLYYGTKHLKVPNGVLAYTCKVNADHSITHTTTFEGGDVIPAGTAVLLQGTGGDYSFTESASAGDKTVGENMLLGYDTDTWTKGPNDATEGYKFFVLSLNADGAATSVGFYYKVANGAAFTSEAHKAFLAVPNDIAEASSYVFDDQTGISNMKMTTNKEGVYTLSGVRVQSDNLPAGLYIVNGKKMVIK